MIELDIHMLKFLMYTLGVIALALMGWDTNKKLKMLVGDYKTLVDHLKKHAQRLEELEREKIQNQNDI